MGANVVLEVQPELKALLSTVSGVASCHARGETLPPFDVYCPLGSLPLALKTEPSSIPATIPYLRADDTRIAKWRPALEALPGKRVALAWAGHARHANDRNRSIDLKLLGPLFASEGVSFVSVQRDLRGDDAARLADVHVIADFGPQARGYDRHRCGPGARGPLDFGRYLRGPSCRSDGARGLGYASLHA